MGNKKQRRETRRMPVNSDGIIVLTDFGPKRIRSKAKARGRAVKASPDRGEDRFPKGEREATVRAARDFKKAMDHKIVRAMLTETTGRKAGIG
jgi:hypothetical protein